MTDHSDRTEFIKEWNKTNDIREVAKELGITYGSARTLAWRLRKQGLLIPKKKAGVKPRNEN